MIIKEEYKSTIEDPLIEPYYIVKDAYCYTIYQRQKSSESGKEYSKAMGHYTYFGHVIKRLAELSITKKANYKSINEYLEELRKMQKHIDQLLKPLI